MFYVYTPSLIIQPRTLKGTTSVKDSSKTQTARQQSYEWKIMPQLQTKKRAPKNGLYRLFYCMGCSTLCKVCLSILSLSICNIPPCITEIQVNLHQPKASISPKPPSPQSLMCTTSDLCMHSKFILRSAHCISLASCMCFP